MVVDDSKLSNIFHDKDLKELSPTEYVMSGYIPDQKIIIFNFY